MELVPTPRPSVVDPNPLSVPVLGGGTGGGAAMLKVRTPSSMNLTTSELNSLRRALGRGETRNGLVTPSLKEARREARAHRKTTRALRTATFLDKDNTSPRRKKKGSQGKRTTPRLLGV